MLSEESKMGVVIENGAKAELFAIDIEKALNDIKSGKILFSSLGNHVEYVPLETTSSSLFGGGKHGVEVFLVSNKTILVDMKRFDRQTGRYLGDLMKKGQGPEEYLWITSSTADDEREEFYLYDRSKSRFYVVGYDATLKKSIPCGEDRRLFNLGNGNVLIARSNSMEETYDDFCVMNVDTEETLSKRRSLALLNIKSLDECKDITTMNRPLVIGRNEYWKYKDEIRYFDYLTDSVYAISKNLKVTPVGTVLMGNLKLTKEQGLVGMAKRDFFTWSMSNILETDSKIIISLTAYKTKPVTEMKWFRLVYSKDNKETELYQVQKDEQVFYNDLDSTVSFHLFQAQNASLFYGFISAEYAKLRAMRSFSEKGEFFKEIAEKLEYDDNELIGLLK